MNFDDATCIVLMKPLTYFLESFFLLESILHVLFIIVHLVYTLSLSILIASFLSNEIQA